MRIVVMNNSIYVASIRLGRRSTKENSGFLLTAALLLAAALQPANAQTTVVIRDITVIDGTGGPVRSAMSVVIDGQKIARIEASSSIEIPAGAVVIDGSGKYLLPGLIDSNVHASIYGNSTRRETVVKYGDRNADLVHESRDRRTDPKQ